MSLTLNKAIVYSNYSEFKKGVHANKQKKKEKLQLIAIKDPIRKTTKGNRQHRKYLK